MARKAADKLARQRLSVLELAQACQLPGFSAQPKLEGSVEESRSTGTR